MVGIEPRFLRSSTQNGRAPSAGAGGASGIISRLTVVASVAAFERHSSRLGCRSEQRSSPPAESRRYVSAGRVEGHGNGPKTTPVLGPNDDPGQTPRGPAQGGGVGAGKGAGPRRARGT